MTRLDRVLPRRSTTRCAACRTYLGSGPASRHHVLPRAQGGDDVAQNLVWLCGSGTTGCHGLVHRGDHTARAQLRRHLDRERPDVVAYVGARTAEQGRPGWLDARLPRYTHDPPEAPQRWQR